MLENWVDLNEWLNDIQPRTVRGRLLCLASNLLDDWSLLKYKIKMRRNRK